MSQRLLVLGGGPGGYVAALRAAHLGARVTVIESRGLGGTCLHRGCIPTKALVATADVLRTVRRANEFGVQVSDRVGVDLAAVVARKQRLVQAQTQGIEHLCKSAKVVLVRGVGALTGPRSAVVRDAEGASRVIESDAVIVATGSEPARPALFPFDGDRVLTTDDALDLACLPESLVIVGGGVTGCEFACIFRALGAQVTVIEQFPRVVASEDEAVSALLLREMKKQGITVRLGTGVTRVEASERGVRVDVSSGESVNAERVLVAVGRSLNSAGIGADAVGLRVGARGEVVVNDELETGVDGVWAVGDVIGRKQLAHAASAQGEVAAERVMGRSARMDWERIPAGIFTAPEIGSVGLTETQARASGRAISVGEFPFRGLAKAHMLGEIAGFVKVVATEDTGEVLGVHIIGPHAAELIHEAVVALRAGASADDVARAIHVHPTLAEVVREAAAAVRGDAVHAVKKG
ncbi:MAG: dihydrolipoyl dehydrogenase [Nitrospirota bacterium]